MSISVAFCATVLLVSNPLFAGDKDVNVINTPDVSVVSIPGAEVRVLAIFCDVLSGQQFAQCQVEPSVPEGKIMKVERIQGGLTLVSPADFDKKSTWQVFIDGSGGFPVSFDISGNPETENVSGDPANQSRTFGEQLTAYGQSKIAVRTRFDSPLNSFARIRIFIVYRLIDGNLETTVVNSPI